MCKREREREGDRDITNKKRRKNNRTEYGPGARAGFLASRHVVARVVRAARHEGHLLRATWQADVTHLGTVPQARVRVRTRGLGACKVISNVSIVSIDD